MTVKTIDDSFYNAHPAFQTRALKDEKFDCYVQKNQGKIQQLFNEVKDVVSSLKNSPKKSEGKQTLQGPVFTIIAYPEPADYLEPAYDVQLVQDLSTPGISDEGEYLKRVDDLSQKIDQSLDTIFSKFSTKDLDKHIAFALSGFVVNIFAQPHAGTAAQLFLDLTQIDPDGVAIKDNST
jgi:hypothetical protein